MTSAHTHSFWAIAVSGELVCCGYNEYGQMGVGTTADVVSFTQGPSTFGSVDRVIFVAPGYSHTLFVTGKLVGTPTLQSKRVGSCMVLETTKEDS